MPYFGETGVTGGDRLEGVARGDGAGDECCG